MSKLVIVIGDYSGGTAEQALASGLNLKEVRSGDSADNRVLNEIIRQDPKVNHVITLPIARQFSPSATGALTKLAAEWAFQILDGQVAGYEDVSEISIVANVAPGIKTLDGADVESGKTNANADREAFIVGTVSKGDKTITVGSTNAFLHGESHTLGYLTDLDPNEFKLSEFQPVGGELATNALKDNGQFRSRALLALMAHFGVEIADKEKPDIIETTAKLQHSNLPESVRDKDLEEARQVLDNFKSFLPFVGGEGRSAENGFVTVITSADKIDEKLQLLSQSRKYKSQLISGTSFDGNEWSEDKALIANLPPEDQEYYRLTRQAHLAANLANEFGDNDEKRTIIIDSGDSPLKTDNVFDVELNNGSHIITSNIKLLALTTHSVKTISFNGEAVDRETTLAPANQFRDYLADKAIENDPYGNIKLAQNFSTKLLQVQNLLEHQAIPESQAVRLAIKARTGNLEEEFSIYYVPGSTSSFGIWGHPKLSSGSTILDAENKQKGSYQAEIFTPGCPTAGFLCTTIPGVTTFAIERAELIDQGLLETPSAETSGTQRVLHATENKQASGFVRIQPYHNIHAGHLRNDLHIQGITSLSELTSQREPNVAR